MPRSGNTVTGGGVKRSGNPRSRNKCRQSRVAATQGDTATRRRGCRRYANGRDGARPSHSSTRHCAKYRSLTHRAACRPSLLRATKRKVTSRTLPTSPPAHPRSGGGSFWRDGEKSHAEIEGSCGRQENISAHSTTFAPVEGSLLPCQQNDKIWNLQC